VLPAIGLKFGMAERPICGGRPRCHRLRLIIGLLAVETEALLQTADRL
jgi:hypothetical protein